jgi:hypothetical protein
MAERKLVLPAVCSAQSALHWDKPEWWRVMVQP